MNSTNKSSDHIRFINNSKVSATYGYDGLFINNSKASSTDMVTIEYL